MKFFILRTYLNGEEIKAATQYLNDNEQNRQWIDVAIADVQRSYNPFLKLIVSEYEWKESYEYVPTNPDSRVKWVEDNA